MLDSQWRRLKNGPQPWEVSPTDWRYFLRNGVVGLVVSILIAAVLLLVLRDIDRMRVAGLALVALAFGQAYVWGFSVLAWRDLNRERARHQMPTRPTPVVAIVSGVIVIVGIAFVGYSLRTEGAWWSTDNLVVSIPGILGLFGGMAIALLLLGHKALTSPINRAMLDREWYQLHGYTGTGPTSTGR